MKKSTKPDYSYEDFHFPAAGIDVSYAFGRQPNKPIGTDKQYRRTCAVGVNVRGYECDQDRNRGGSRSGLVRYVDAKVAGETFIVQDVSALSGTGGTPVQTSQSGRVVYLVAVCEGRLFYVVAGGTAWTEATNLTGETPPLNFSGIMFSAPNQQKMWFVDGVNKAVYVPALGGIYDWNITAGTFPVDADGNLPRLIELWRGRTVVSGLLGDPHNIFFSRVDDPTNFDYAPDSPSALDAVALNVSNGLGLIGDVVNCMIPYTDDILIIGGDSSIHILRGDPLDGGRIDTVTHTIGMAFGRPWCMDPYGNIYFFSNRTGIYTMVPGQQPVRISQPIESLIADIDTGKNAIRLMWNDDDQCVYVFITWLEEPTPTQHFVYEARSGAWWIQVFANDDHNPLCCCQFDGNLSSDRVALIGSWDGYVRAIDRTATDDDGTEIVQEVIIGPIASKNLDELTISEAICTLGAGSADVFYDLLLGRTPEQALASDPVETGVWQAGREVSAYMNWSAHAFYIRLRSKTPVSGRNNRWAMETIRLKVRGRGPTRGRGQD